jgi:hypothetical protein
MDKKDVCHEDEELVKLHQFIELEYLRIFLTNDDMERRKSLPIDGVKVLLQKYGVEDHFNNYITNLQKFCLEMPRH